MDEEHEATENSGPVEESSLFTDVESSVNAASDTICNGDIDLGEVIVECDDSQDAEEGRIARFVAGGCSCKLAGGSPCCYMFSAPEYRAMWDECRGLTHDELDLVVMGQLRAVTQRDELTQKTKASNSFRSRTSTQFRFGGHRVCISTFCFLHAMGQKRFKAIKSSWVENGLRPRNRVCHLPHNTTRLSDIERVVHFILRYSEENAILLPGRITGYKRDNLQLLPSSTTKRSVWELYHLSVGQVAGACAVCYSLFCSLWLQLTPQVVITKPMSDLCWTCQQNSTLIMRSQNRPVEEKSEVNMLYTHRTPCTLYMQCNYYVLCNTHCAGITASRTTPHACYPGAVCVPEGSGAEQSGSTGPLPQ